MRKSRARLPLPIRFPDELPVCALREQIGEAIRAHPVVIVCGETGSGKTTQLPKICLAIGRGTERMIGHTQPRRIAASSVARRIAEELATPLGEVVGYKVRFTDHTREGVAVKLMTDGILLAETQRDPRLEAYDTIIIDEAHERSLNIDFLLGYLRQLLPRRPDLKLIITSATLDAERFARHFGSADQPAPVINVSGRLYPVEIRYRAVREEDDAEDRTLMDAIVDAVGELALAGRGDVLVFLPGEREIREASEALRKHHPPGTEMLPLFARLSVEEQERVFQPGGARRIVLATNIAETSLTVPGIRYVVDSGLARVKRYSYRNKVEQLQVEPISQAAAAQRAGRCGRVADGICIRLYDEQDHARRAPFTDPEILRSSLAAVILQMKSLGLGEVAEFPFVQPPPARAIADGYQLLAELNAVDERNELTPIGHELARLPLDPRLGRMLLAARDQHCLREMLIIASALSVQDPRERPLAAQEAADQAHRRYADERSEFAGLVKLWEALQQRLEHKKSNRRLADELRQEFISPRRLREWIDVHSQLQRIVSELGWRPNASPPTYEQLHLSLLAGLLGNVGCKSPDADPADRREPPYLGARSIKFHVWPGSPMARKAARWIVAAELVETSRLFARTVAAVEPLWLERVGAHLLKRTWGDPHWEKRSAQVVAFERGTLYGLMVYQQRRADYGPIDPATSRTLFIREALVGGELDTRAPFMAHNRKLIGEIRELEHKARRPDVLVDEELIFAFYDQRVPASVVGGASFERWREQAERDDPRVLFLSREELMRHQAAGVTPTLYPKSLTMGGLEMALSYHFEPGSPRDGATLTVPLYALNQVDPVRCEWLVPGMLREKVHLLLKSLPQKLRRHCVPLPEYAQGFTERWPSFVPDDATEGKPSQARSTKEGTPSVARSAKEGLIDALIQDVREHAGVTCAPADFKLESLPAHLTMNFKVVDPQGRQLAMGRNLSSLQAELGAQARQQFQQLADAGQAPAPHNEQPITDWDFGELAPRRQVHRDGQTLVGYPALVDRGDHCTLELFDDPLTARGRHREGLRRLFSLQLRQQIQHLQRSLSSLQTVRMQASVVPSLSAALPSFEDLRDQVVGAAIDRTCLEEPWPANREQFVARKDEARGRLSLIAQQVAGLAATIVQEAAQLPKKLAAARSFSAACSDVEQQLARLFPKRFIEQTPAAQLAHYPRYLKAVGARLDKLKVDPARDKALMSELGPLQTAYARALAARKGVADPRLEEFRWLLEELRVSLFAQELRTPMPVSVKRLQKVWASLEG
ncbi:MAG TPA: ATP-dependent RNA helicase HrpA [Burkholderiaceae bacterium]|nr:ATP-dependent RNA helicase HrpA [Burkholderiaceae bacterium]